MKKKIWIIAIIALMTLGFVGMVSAAEVGTMTWNEPATGGTISGTEQKFNVTFGGPGNCTNISYYIVNGDGTAGGTYIGSNITAEKYNLSESQINFSYFDTVAGGLNDTETYTLNVTCRNNDTFLCDSVITVYVDNTNPVVTLDDVASDTTYEPGLAIDEACYNATRAVLYFDSNAYEMTMTNTPEGGETCAYDFGSGLPAELMYSQVYITAYDLNDDTTTSTYRTSVQIDTGKSTGKNWYILNQAQEQVVTEEQAVTKKSTFGILVLIGLVIFAVTRKKKGK